MSSEDPLLLAMLTTLCNLSTLNFKNFFTIILPQILNEATRNDFYRSLSTLFHCGLAFVDTSFFHKLIVVFLWCTISSSITFANFMVFLILFHFVKFHLSILMGIKVLWAPDVNSTLFSYTVCINDIWIMFFFVVVFLLNLSLLKFLLYVFLSNQWQNLFCLIYFLYLL